MTPNLSPDLQLLSLSFPNTYSASLLLQVAQLSQRDRATP